MSKSIIKPIFSRAMSQVTVGDTLSSDDPIAQQIFQWLGNLKLLHNVPFRYLVPDERLLPPESIKFFHLDLNWVNALVDGANSIGRYATGLDTQTLYNKVEGSLGQGLTAGSTLAARNNRPNIFKAPAPNDPAPFEVVTGFLLRSKVVKGWKNLQVSAFDKNNYPDPPNREGTALPILRFEHLSEEVLIGIFEGEMYRLDIHEPSEGLHFGFDMAQGDLLSKNLRNPIDGTNAGAGLSPTDLNNNQIFRNGNAGSPTTGNPGGQVINLYNLSVLLNQKLNGQGLPPGYTEPAASVLIDGKSTNVSGLSDTMNPLVSSDFALQMVEGVGMVSFYNTAPSDPIDCGKNPA